MKPEDPAVALGERRSSPRQSCVRDVCLLSLRGYEILHCRLHDLSASGLYVSAPIGYGLAVGQRFEVLLGDGAGPRPSPRLMSGGHRASVVRTRMALSPGGDSIGVGLRFEQPVAV